MADQALPGLYVQVSNVSDPIAQANFQRIQTWSRSVSPLIYQVTSPLVGILPMPPAPQDCYVIQSGSPSVSFSGGYAHFTFTQPFPNGVLSATVNLVSIGAADCSIEVLNHLDGTAPTTITQLGVYATYSGSPVSGTFQISFIVLGW